jgi:hypothetical protein
VRLGKDVPGLIDGERSIDRHGCLLCGMSWRVLMRPVVDDILRAQSDENAGQHYDRHGDYQLPGRAEHFKHLLRPPSRFLDVLLRLEVPR